MQEIVTLEQFSRVMAVVAVAAPLLGVTVGAVMARVRGSRQYFLRGLALGFLGPLAWLAWLLFRWTVRIDPETHYVGLYRPQVLLTDVLIFLTAGIALGLLYRKVFRPAR
jgi:hypothetical protein